MQPTYQMRNVEWVCSAVFGGERQCHDRSCRFLRESISHAISQYRRTCTDTKVIEQIEFDVLEPPVVRELFEFVEQCEALLLTSLPHWSITDTGDLGRHQRRTNEKIERHDMVFAMLRRLPKDHRRALLVIGHLKNTMTKDDVLRLAAPSGGVSTCQELMATAFVALGLPSPTFYRRVREAKERFAELIEEC